MNAHVDTSKMENKQLRHPDLVNAVESSCFQTRVALQELFFMFNIYTTIAF